MSTPGTFRHRTSVFSVVLTILALSFTAGSSVLAVSLSPELVDSLRVSGQLQSHVEMMLEARARGVWAPNPSIASRDAAGQALQFDPNQPDTFRVLVVLVDFSDNTAAGGQVYGSTADFMHLLFSYDDNDNHYSMAEFYRDNSYGGFIMQGTVVGWVRAPQTYAYYVNGQRGFGSYPQNAQKMAEDALILANPLVDYSQFDRDGNGRLDGVFIVHAGPGYEQTGNVNHVHSHAWSTSYTLNLDGVAINSYTMEPEENTSSGLSTMGVYAHEYGHFLGLPDLYDTDYSSSGVGSWSLMAGGSWNSNGRYPAFMDAWCKKEVGFLQLTNITSCTVDMSVVSSYHQPVAYRLWTNGTVGSQYFLIENRQRRDKDIGIPASGLLIYHIDESQWGNSDETHPLVGVEQADGRNDLASGANSGDGGDVWTAYTKNAFDDLTVPNSRTYTGAVTQTAVWDISGPDSIMTAGFDVAYCRPRFELLSGTFSDAAYGNNNGVAEAGETLTFTFNIRNLWLTGTNVTGTLAADNNDIVFGTPQANVGTISTGASKDNNLSPIVFTVPGDFIPCIDSFFLSVEADQVGGEKTFGFELHIGDPTVLLVDDDNGGTWNQTYEQLLFNRRMPFDVWEKSVQGTPSGATLAGYEMVIWFTGNTRADILSAADVVSMKAYLDGGGSLFLTGQTIVKELNTDDQSFLNNYLRATYMADQLYPFHYGASGSVVGDGIKIRYYTGTNQTNPQKIQTINGSVDEFTLPVGGSTVISYDGSYKLVLASFGLEGIGDEFVASGWATKDTVLGRIMEFFAPDTAVLNPLVPAATVTGGASALRLTDHTPEFSWTFDDTAGGSQLEYQVQVGTGNLCYNWDNMWSPPVFTGADTTIVYAGLPLADGKSYVFRVRAFNGTNWSGWRQITFRMNAVAAAGLLVSPLQDTVVTSATPSLKVANVADPDGDVMTYGFEVYADLALTTLVAQASGVAQQASHTIWTVPAPLADDARYWWRSRTFDGQEYGPYTATGVFRVNAENQAPSAFSLITPVNGSISPDGLPTFEWQTAIDGDIADGVSYVVWVSTDSLFGIYTATETDDTVLALFDPLAMGATYYWKVKAVDLFGGTTWSSETYRVVTPTLTCCLRRGDFDRNGGISVSDVTSMVNFLFKGGPAAVCDEEADVDYSGGISVSDLTFLVNYVFKGGLVPPACPS